MRPSHLSAATALLTLVGTLPAVAGGEQPQPCDMNNGTSVALTALPGGKGVSEAKIGSPESGVASAVTRDPSYLRMLQVLMQNPVAPADKTDANTSAGNCLAAAAGAAQMQMAAAPTPKIVAAIHPKPSFRERVGKEMHHLAHIVTAHLSRAGHLRGAGV